MRNKALKKLTLVAAIVFGVLLFVPNFSFAKDQDYFNDCLNAQTDGWISCSIIDSIKGSIEGLYTWFIENWLAINPRLFSFNGSGQTTHFAWSYFQGLANILLIVFLILVILSQVTGLGLSNYGVKKALPRIVVAAIVINLSYYICQIVVDLSNLAGSGVFALLKEILDKSGIQATGENNAGFVAGLIGILMAVISVMVNFVRVSPAFITVILWALISALIGVLFLFVILGLRQVFSVLLVVVSPLAILCSSIPGLRSVYKRWLSMFKTLILAYPVCSIMIGGGAFAAQVLYSAWDADHNFFAAVACLIVCVAPFFMIVPTIKQSIGALDSIVDKVKNGSNGRGGLKGLANKGLKNSDLGRRLDNATRKKEIYRGAGIKSDFGGNAMRDGDGRIRRTRRGARRGGDAHFYDRAFNQIDRENEISNFRNNPNMVLDQENRRMIDEYIRHMKSSNTSDDDIKEILKRQIGNLRSTSVTAGPNDLKSRESQSIVAACTNMLSSSRGGRNMLRDTLENTVNGLNATQRDNVCAAMFSGLSTEEVTRLRSSDPLLGDFAMRARNPSVATGEFSTNNYSAGLLSSISNDEFANLDDSLKKEIFEAAGARFGNNNKIDSSGMSDNALATTLEGIASGALSNPDSVAKMSLSSQEWARQFVDERTNRMNALVGVYSGSSAGIASLETLYQNSASNGKAIDMAAVETILRNNGVGNDRIEVLRQKAEGTAKENAIAAVNLSRMRQK